MLFLHVTKTRFIATCIIYTLITIITATIIFVITAVN